MTRRYERLRQARDYIAEHVHEPVFLDELCGALALSERGVEKLFQDLMQVTPSVYLRHLRLHGVRHSLRGTIAGPGAVKETALDWGFCHLGRFAGQYRRLFGELPSDTLANPC